MAWEENSRICLHMQLIAILSRIGVEIDCKQGKVPALLIPQAIRNYLKENYPAQAVKKIEMNKNEYEVELANGLDLTFNKHFQVIDID